MADTNNALIKMEGVKKVFLTDEVETHALEEIHLEIQRGQYVSIAGLPVAASRRCCRFWGCWIRPRKGLTS